MKLSSVGYLDHACIYSLTIEVSNICLVFVFFFTLCFFYSLARNSEIYSKNIFIFQRLILRSKDIFQRTAVFRYIYLLQYTSILLVVQYIYYSIVYILQYTISNSFHYIFDNQLSLVQYKNSFSQVQTSKTLLNFHIKEYGFKININL